MIIYGALLIPLIVAMALYFFFRRSVVWWEFFVPLAVSLLLTFIMKLTIEHVQVSSTEYWGSMVSRAVYYEPWNEWITQTCYSTCCCDDKGNNCQQVPYDCSYELNHAAEWKVETTTGEGIGVSEARYKELKERFGNDKFINMHRHYYTLNGDGHVSEWQADSVTAEPVTTVHTYENRVKAADQSVFHFEKVDTADIRKYSLKGYPAIGSWYRMAAVIGDTGRDAGIADKKLQYANGILGPKKQARIFVLVFKGQPIEAGLYQEWLWSGGNKNEFIVCIGIDAQRNVKWCKPISWTYNERLKVDVRDFVQAQGKLDLIAVAAYVQQQVDKGFQRKHFREFSYLTVEPPTWAVILTYLLTLAINIGLSYWIVKNEFDDTDDDSRESGDPRWPGRLSEDFNIYQRNR